MHHQNFSSSTKSWDDLFAEAAAFATEVGPERLISISHSHNGPTMGGLGLVTVWYWWDEGGATGDNEGSDLAQD